MSETLQTGVIGVGTMGQHHARVYHELNDAELIGVADADTDRAESIATTYDTAVYDTKELISAADAVSLAVPTTYHYDLATTCIEAETDCLIEKPFVEDPEKGRRLVRRANAADVMLQVGHIERFNPVTETLGQIIPSLDVLSVTARRLGPPPNRTIGDSAVTDLMIHDIDVLLALLDTEVDRIEAAGNADGRYATTTLTFADDTVGTLTASRVTQRKIRELTITAASGYVTVDYLNQSIEIHRQSTPEYISEDGNMRYRHEGIVERPAVSTGEPLKQELQSFTTAVRNGDTPRVDGTDGVRAVEVAQQINEAAFGTRTKRVHAEGVHQ